MVFSGVVRSCSFDILCSGFFDAPCLILDGTNHFLGIKYRKKTELCEQPRCSFSYGILTSVLLLFCRFSSREN
jgi:hypothetical protein